MTRAFFNLTLGIFVMFALSADAEAAKKKGKRPQPKPNPGASNDDDGGSSNGGGSSGGKHGAADGFGKAAKGAGGSPKKVSASSSAINSAVKGGGNVLVSKGDVDVKFDGIKVGSNCTFDGGGATLWYPGTNHNGKGLILSGKNIVVRNLRIRNAGDGIVFGSKSIKPAEDVLIENVSITGCGDDGLSPSYNCKRITFRWGFMAGNARCVFMKYGGEDLTIHHSILTHFWIRGPLVSGKTARVQFVNNMVQNWSMWGSRCESGAKGDFVNNTWRFEKWAGGKSDAALFPYSGGQVYSSGNEFVGCKQRTGMSKSPVVNAPSVQKDDAKAALTKVLSDSSGAGCMPRDQVDKNYLASKKRCPGGDPAHGLQVEGSRLK